MQTSKIIKLVFSLVIITGSASCAGASIFPPIGANMANPLSVAVDSTTNRLYIVNSNYRVEYDSGSVHVVDITNPAAPSRLDYMEILQFAGQVYLDAVNLILYTPDRYSTSQVDTVDALLGVNVNTASGTYKTQTQYAAGNDPYGIACCDASNRILVAAKAGVLDYYSLDSGLAHDSLSLTTLLSNGNTISGAGATRVVIYGTQAVVTSDNGGLLVINLDQLGVSGAYPIDYFISDVTSPRGITTDGTYIYVASIEYPSNVATPTLLVLDISSLTPRTDNTNAEIIDKDDSGLVVAEINIVDADPQGVVVAGGNVYVSHFGAASVSVVSIASLARATSVSVGVEPYEMAVYSPGGIDTHVVVANSGANTVSIIDMSTNTVVATYP